MSELAHRIDRALIVLGGIAAQKPSGGALEATTLPQIALLRHARGLATQDPAYSDTTNGTLIGGIVDALIGANAAAVQSDIADRAKASWAAVPITNSRAA